MAHVHHYIRRYGRSPFCEWCGEPEPEEVDGYREGILIRTDFQRDGFGIDPEGCGCTDCLTGQSFNVGDSRIDIAVAQGRVLYNRSGCEVILPNGYRLDDDQVWYGEDLLHMAHCPGCNCRR